MMATRGQSDMRGFGYPHDRLVRRERRSSRVERGRKGLLIAEPRMLLAPAGRAPRGVRTPASAVHDREAPAPAGELAGHGHGGHRGALATGVEAPPAAVQTALGGGGALPHQGRLALSAAGQLAARPRGAALVPGGLDQQAPGVAVAGLGDRPLRAALAGGALAGYQPEVGADRAPVEALPVADLTGEAEGGEGGVGVR
jgi:hypothetical protein